MLVWGNNLGLSAHVQALRAGSGEQPAFKPLHSAQYNWCDGQVARTKLRLLLIEECF